MQSSVPGVDINKASNDGWTAVVNAAWFGHTEIVRALLTAPGIDVNRSHGYTAVMVAAFKGHAEVLRVLLAAPGVDVNAVHDGWTAVMLAAWNGRTEATKALLAAPGIDINKKFTGRSIDGWAEGKAALGIAIKKYKHETAALLKTAGAIEEENVAPETVPATAKSPPEGTGKRIYDAAKAGDVAALRPLLQEWSGHDVLNWANPDDSGWTPLIVGCREGKTEAVRLLIATPGESHAVAP